MPLPGQKPTGESAAQQNVATKKLTASKATSQNAAGSKPTVQKASAGARKTTGQNAAGSKPAVQKASANAGKVIGQNAAGHKPTVQKASAGTATGQNAVGQKPTVQKASAGKTTGQNAAGPKPTVQKASANAGKVIGQNSAGHKPTVQKVSTGKPTGQNLAGRKPTAQKASAGAGKTTGQNGAAKKTGTQKAPGGKPTGQMVQRRLPSNQNRQDQMKSRNRPPNKFKGGKTTSKVTPQNISFEMSLPEETPEQSTVRAADDRAPTINTTAIKAKSSPKKSNKKTSGKSKSKPKPGPEYKCIGNHHKLPFPEQLTKFLNEVKKLLIANDCEAESVGLRFIRKVGVYLFVAEATPINAEFKPPGFGKPHDLDIDWFAPQVPSSDHDGEHEKQLCCVRSENNNILFLGTPFSSFEVLHTGGIWNGQPQIKLMRGEFVKSKWAIIRFIKNIWQNFPPTNPPSKFQLFCPENQLIGVIIFHKDDNDCLVDMDICDAEENLVYRVIPYSIGQTHMDFYHIYDSNENVVADFMEIGKEKYTLEITDTSIPVINKIRIFGWVFAERHYNLWNLDHGDIHRGDITDPC